MKLAQEPPMNLRKNPRLAKLLGKARISVFFYMEV